VTIHLTYRTLATRNESDAIIKALPEVANSSDAEIYGSLFIMSQLLPLTTEMEFHFEGEEALIEVLSLRDFWEQRPRLGNDWPAVWELWTNLLSTDAYLEWWHLYENRGGSQQAEPVLRMTDQEVASSADPN
jgi:hypothetical protein